MLSFFIMKEGIHPEYHPEATASCSCGNEIVVGSTATEMTVEVCSSCHPFYTGKQKLVDVAGRIDKFKKRMEQSDKLGGSKDKKKTTSLNNSKSSDNVVKLG